MPPFHLYARKPPSRSRKDLTASLTYYRRMALFMRDLRPITVPLSRSLHLHRQHGSLFPSLSLSVSALPPSFGIHIHSTRLSKHTSTNGSSVQPRLEEFQVSRPAKWTFRDPTSHARGSGPREREARRQSIFSTFKHHMKSLQRQRHKAIIGSRKSTTYSASDA